jgi:hypothetical protein
MKGEYWNIIDVPWSLLGSLISLGEPIKFIHSNLIPVVRKTFNHHVYENAILSDNDLKLYKKALLLPLVLFTNSGSNVRANLFDKCERILQDNWSDFTLNTFPGRYSSNTKPQSNAKPKIAKENQTHSQQFKERKQRFNRVYTHIEDGEIARAFNALKSTAVPAAHTNETFEYLQSKHPSKPNMYDNLFQDENDLDFLSPPPPLLTPESLMSIVQK